VKVPVLVIVANSVLKRRYSDVCIIYTTPPMIFARKPDVSDVVSRVQCPSMRYNTIELVSCSGAGV
jgi:hypothetical protein